MAFQLFMVCATYVPSLNNLEQQTTETEEVEFIIFLYVSVACKLYPPFLVGMKVNPSLEGATWSFRNYTAKFSG